MAANRADVLRLWGVDHRDTLCRIMTRDGRDMAVLAAERYAWEAGDLLSEVIGPGRAAEIYYRVGDQVAAEVRPNLAAFDAVPGPSEAPAPAPPPAPKRPLAVRAWSRLKSWRPGRESWFCGMILAFVLGEVFASWVLR